MTNYDPTRRIDPSRFVEEEKLFSQLSNKILEIKEDDEKFEIKLYQATQLLEQAQNLIADVVDRVDVTPSIFQTTLNTFSVVDTRKRMVPIIQQSFQEMMENPLENFTVVTVINKISAHISSANDLACCSMIMPDLLEGMFEKDEEN